VLTFPFSPDVFNEPGTGIGGKGKCEPGRDLGLRNRREPRHRARGEETDQEKENAGTGFGKKLVPFGRLVDGNKKQKEKSMGEHTSVYRDPPGEGAYFVFCYKGGGGLKVWRGTRKRGAK